MKYKYDVQNGLRKIRSKTFVVVASAVMLLGGGAGLSLVSTGSANAANGNGFDQYGYNTNARVFVGNCVSWYLGKLGGTQADAENYCGAYSNDKLVMKWNAAWDNCNTAGNDNVDACLGATLTNEWNGMAKGGSGETEHVKIIWVGSLGESSPYWRDGGYLIWNNYEALMDQGMTPDGHYVYAHAVPNGFGVVKSN